MSQERLISQEAIDQVSFKPLRWFLRRYFGNSFAIRNSAAVLMLGFLAMLLMVAAGGPLAWVVILGIVAGIGGLAFVVSLGKFHLDYVAAHRNKVTDQNVFESLCADIWKWLKAHPVDVCVGGLLCIGALVTICLFTFAPTALPIFMLNAIHFLANGIVGVFGASSYAASLAFVNAIIYLFVSAIFLWDVLCRITNGLIFPEKDQNTMSAYFEAAKEGDPEALFQLGLCYEKGKKGAIKDHEAAVYYYKLAAAADYTEAQFRLSFYYLTGSRIRFKHADNMSKEEAIAYCQLAADKGHVEAQYCLAIYYFNEWRESQRWEKQIQSTEDFKNAMHYFQLAADQGHAGAQGYLSDFYNGRYPTVTTDLGKVIDYARLAAAQEDVDAQRLLAGYYLDGIGVQQDSVKAAQAFYLLAQQGDHAAQFCLGLCYYEGEGVTANRAEAVKWFRYALEEGYGTDFNIWHKLRKLCERDKDLWGEIYAASHASFWGVSPEKIQEKLNEAARTIVRKDDDVGSADSDSETPVPSNE